MYILYIEDNDFDRLAFKRLMKNFPDIEYDVADSYKKMHMLVSEKNYDAVIQDVYLKGISEVRDQLKIPCYFTSGSQAALDRLREKEIEPERLLLKPLREKDILRLIAECGETERGLKATPDFRIIDEWAEGDDSFRKGMVELFLDEVPQQLSKAQTALQDREYLDFAELIHAMQTKFRTFGLDEINQVADKLEENARAGTIDYKKAKQKLDWIRTALQKTIKILNQEQSS